jgi:predicted nucleotide-binding protein (sugar kinase/HSP70/actin superfamily)
MKLSTFTFLILGALVGCSRQDVDHTKRQLHEAGQEAKREAHEAKDKLKQGAHEASREMKRGVDEIKREVGGKNTDRDRR